MREFLEVMLQTSVRACVAALGVGLALVLFRVRSAAMRHAAWVAVVGAMLLMAPIHAWLPAIPLPASAATVEPGQFVYEAPPQIAPVIPRAVAPSVAKTPAPTPAIPSVNVPPPARFPWIGVALTTYLIGLLISLASLFTGWLTARRFAASREPTGETFYQSQRTVTPVTAGIFFARVILPADWCEWPALKLRAVLAHEASHVQRRDNLTNAIALFNRAIFWFHPLAWWLQRQLASLAEEACDQEAITATGSNRNYAAVLLELADAARRSRGRLVWQSGMAGMGIERRIARILDSNSEQRASLPKRTAIVLCCAATILFAAACQRQIASGPLRDNPERTALFARMARDKQLVEEVRAMTADQAAALESRLAANPDDVELRRQLLLFYRERGVATIGISKTIEARRRHIIWFIEHRPESNVLAFERISPTQLDPLPDPAGYAECKKLWQARMARAEVTTAELGHAADFFFVNDKPLAEEALLRAQRMDNAGRWTEQLGRLYAQTLVGSNAWMPDGVVRSVSVTDANGAFAAAVRRKLDESTDPRLLTMAGEQLLRQGPLIRLDRQGTLQPVPQNQINPGPLAKQYIERALQLDPQSTLAHRTMVMFRLAADTSTWHWLPQAEQYPAISRLPERQRVLALARYAENQYFHANDAEYQRHDPVTAKPIWQAAAKSAKESLDLGSKFRSDPDYGTAYFTAHMVLGMAAMHDSHRKEAIDHLLAAAAAPATDELRYSHQFGTDKLPIWLLKDGEREPVVQFLERFAQTDVVEKQRLLDAATAIRSGQKPLFYPY